MAQQYSLKWNNHQPNFISMFAMLRSTQALVDVTLSAEGRQIHAHKMVLSACSPYFHSLFVDNPTQHTIVILKDVAFSDLKTIVDFMYYGEVNITQDELPQMLNSAKSLKVKGLTETESTSVMRSQSSEFAYETSGEAGGEGAEMPTEPPAHSQEQCAEPPSDPHADERRGSASPANSPSAKRRRRRKSSNASTSLNMVGEEHGMPDVRDVTVSSLPRRRDFDDSGAHTQNTEPQNISIDDLNVEHNAANMQQGGQWSMMEHTYPRYSNSCFGGGGGGGGMQAEGGVHAHYMSNMMHSHMDGEGGLELLSSLRLRRVKHLRRQGRVEERGTRRQASTPAPPPVAPPSLRKHHSYPQFARATSRRTRPGEPQVMGALLNCAVTVIDRRPSGSGEPSEASEPAPPRASHTPAVRSGPPLSCNFCWNTVDECGRILRRKTQYHCPECRTNLCIVPCFHEYHEAGCELPARVDPPAVR